MPSLPNLFRLMKSCGTAFAAGHSFCQVHKWGKQMKMAPECLEELCMRSERLAIGSQEVVVGLAEQPIKVLAPTPHSRSHSWTLAEVWRDPCESIRGHCSHPGPKSQCFDPGSPSGGIASFAALNSARPLRFHTTQNL